eukprot:17409-Heterococcus_DN1.PRE.3
MQAALSLHRRFWHQLRHGVLANTERVLVTHANVICTLITDHSSIPYIAWQRSSALECNLKK